MTRTPIPAAVLECRVVAIARRLAPGSFPLLATALLREDLRVLEVTMDAPDALLAIESMAATDLVVGAGTVMTIAQAQDAVAAGATFIVAPHTDVDVVRWCVDHAVPVMPGAFTPSEVVNAWNAGASAVKLFPASTGGPGHLASVRGPLADIPLLPTGGIDASNAASYLDAGAIAVGIGGWLTAAMDADTIAGRARELATAVRRP